MKDVEMARKEEQDSRREEDDTEYQPVNWKKIFLSPKYIPFHLIGLAIIAATTYITIHQEEVVQKLQPFSEKLRDLPAGFLIPIAVLIIISFPPLFGHELVALLVGAVWGLYEGFGIVAAGTFFGEVGTWFAFKSLLRKRAQKLERTNLNYGALARITRDGGFWIVLIIRLSVIPSHFSTAVFSTCDVKFWHFAVATFLALPKQIFLVYLGVLLVAKNEESPVKTIISGATFVITIALGGWIYYKLRKIKKVLLEEQAQRRAEREMTHLKEAEAVQESESAQSAEWNDQNAEYSAHNGEWNAPPAGPRNSGPRNFSRPNPEWI